MSGRSRPALPARLARLVLGMAVTLAWPVVQAQGMGSRPPAGATLPAEGAPAPRPGLPRVAGVVEAIDTAAGELVLRHAAIPNLGMDAMTMAFRLKDPRLLERLEPGDRLEFQADMRQGDAEILWFRKIR